MRKFDGKRFCNADPPDFLDYAGAEFVLVGAKEDPEKELGIRMDPDDETKQSADIFKDLRLRRDQQPTEPLFEGKWK